MKRIVFASASLALRGVILMGMGLYFSLLRPALLPEDMLFIGASLEQIQTAVPGLQLWFSRVFGVLGGFMAATSVLTVYVAATGFRAGTPGATAVVLISRLASIDWMAATNFLINSDFEWLLLVFALSWVAALALAWSGRSGPFKRE